MPELPEVETVRRGLAPVMEGKAILSVILNRPDLRFPLPARFADYIATWPDIPGDKQLANLSNREIEAISLALTKWQIVPTGTEGWRTAEVTASESGLSPASRSPRLSNA